MRLTGRRAIWRLVLVVAVAAACSAPDDAPGDWADTEVSFVADGLTLHGSYRHQAAAQRGPAALLISESGQTDRNGDNIVAGAVGNMRQLADLLADRGVASLRYDKVGTGRTGLGPYASRPQDVGSAVYTAGAAAALGYLADQPATDPDRISVYALGEGTIHAMALAGADGTPAIHALGLLQPLPGRYLDNVTARVRANGSPEALSAWLAAVDQVRTEGTVPADLPDGLGAILNPGNAHAVREADAIDPLALAAQIPAGTAVLFTCSDSDGQADCDAERPLMAALRHTDLTVVELTGVNHVLRDDASDNVANYAQQSPLSPQLVSALDRFVGG